MGNSMVSEAYHSLLHSHTESCLSPGADKSTFIHIVEEKRNIHWLKGILVTVGAVAKVRFE